MEKTGDPMQKAYRQVPLGRGPVMRQKNMLLGAVGTGEWSKRQRLTGYTR